MILSLAVLAASAVPAAPAPFLPAHEPTRAPSVDDHSARWYDLRAIVAASAATPAGVDLRLHLSSAAIDALEPDGYDLWLGAEPSLSIDDCVAAIRAAIGVDDAAKLVKIDARAGLVHITGNDAAQAVAARVIAALGVVATDSVDVEVFRIDDAQLPTSVGAVLDSAQAMELIGRLDGITAHRHAVRIGRASGLGEESFTTYVRDHDVEVAQGAIAADPVVTVLRTGLHVGVRVDRASDGQRLVVRVWGRDGELQEPLEHVELASLGNAQIEVPRVATSMWTSSAIVGPGGAIVIDHDGGGKSALVLRVWAPTGSETPTALLPLGELALVSMRPPLPSLAFAGPSGGWPIRDSSFPQTTSPWTDDVSLSTFVASAFEGAVNDGLAIPFGSALLLPAPDAIDESAREAVEALRAAAPVATIAVDVRYGVIRSPQARAALEKGDLNEIADSLDGRLLGCGVENDALMLVGGVEFAYLQDHDMMIAAGAMVADPIVQEVFEGVAVWCSPLRSVDGRVIAWFDVQAHAPSPPVRDVYASSYRPGPGDGNKNSPGMTGRFMRDLTLQLPVTHRAAARTLVQAQEGEWTLVTAQPVAGSDRTLIVLTRMTTH